MTETTMTTETTETTELPQTAETTPSLMPAVDVYQSPADVLLVADLPGAKPEAVHIAIEGRVLSLEAEARVGSNDLVTYRRKFNLGPDLDAEAVSAQVRDGVLSVTLPRVAPAGPRTIEVRAA